MTHQYQDVFLDLIQGKEVGVKLTNRKPDGFSKSVEVLDISDLEEINVNVDVTELKGRYIYSKQDLELSYGGSPESEAHMTFVDIINSIMPDDRALARSDFIPVSFILPRSISTPGTTDMEWKHINIRYDDKDGRLGMKSLVKNSEYGSRFLFALQQLDLFKTLSNKNEVSIIRSLTQGFDLFNWTRILDKDNKTQYQKYLSFVDELHRHHQEARNGASDKKREGAVTKMTQLIEANGVNVGQGFDTSEAIANYLKKKDKIDFDKDIKHPTSPIDKGITEFDRTKSYYFFAHEACCPDITKPQVPTAITAVSENDVKYSRSELNVDNIDTNRSKPMRERWLSSLSLALSFASGDIVTVEFPKAQIKDLGDGANKGTTMPTVISPAYLTGFFNKLKKDDDKIKDKFFTWDDLEEIKQDLIKAKENGIDIRNPDELPRQEWKVFDGYIPSMIENLDKAVGAALKEKSKQDKKKSVSQKGIDQKTKPTIRLSKITADAKAIKTFLNQRVNFKFPAPLDDMMEPETEH